MKRELIFPATIAALFFLTACSNLYEASVKGDSARVISIIDQGADIDKKGGYGITPLMAAVKEGRTNVVRVLLAKGAKPDLKDNFGKSALWYAFASDRFEIFKIILEKVSRPDFVIDEKNISSSKVRKEMYRLVQEYGLYSKIKYNQHTKSLKLYDRYMSSFPEGYYSKEIESFVKKMIDADYIETEAKGSALRLKGFIDKWSRLGKNKYRVEASTLNIRVAKSSNARKTGQYKKGDMIYAIDMQHGWIRTDRGWISGQYTTRIHEQVSVVTPYLDKVKKRLSALSQTHEPTSTPRVYRKKPKIRKSKTEIKPSVTTQAVQGNIKKNLDIDHVQNELDRILDAPDLEALEAFINKYKDDEKYLNMVMDAKKKYQTMILDN